MPEIDWFRDDPSYYIVFNLCIPCVSNFYWSHCNSSTVYTGQDLVLDEYCGRFENLIYRKEIFETPSVYFNKTVLLTTCGSYRGSCTADKVRYLFLNDWVFTVFTLSSFQNNVPIFLENVVFVQSVLFSFSKSKKLFSDFQFQIIFTDCNCL